MTCIRITRNQIHVTIDASEHEDQLKRDKYYCH